jgi:hypothetical protein
MFMKNTLFFWFKVLVGLCAFCTVTLAHVDEQTPCVAQTDRIGETFVGNEDSSTEAVNATTLVPNRGLGGTLPDHLQKRRYKVEALSFRCIEETGHNWPGSDEIVVLIKDPILLLEAVSGIYEDVDAGDSRSFEPGKNCILPIRNCSNAGIPGPFAFTVMLYEMDRPNFSGACLGAPFGGPAECIYPDSGDELIGYRLITFTAEELAEVMPNVYDTFDETIRLRGEGAEYMFTYRLTRLPDQEPVLDPGP